MSEEMFQLAHIASSSELYRFALAGGLCSTISHAWTVPIDVVKTRLQTDETLFDHDMVEATKQLVEKEGPGVLFQGMGATVIGFTIQGSVKYGTYEWFKPFIYNGVTHSPVAVFLLAGAVSEVIGSTLLCPLEATRIRLVCDPRFGREVFDALPRLWNERGLGVFGGLPAILCKHVPGNMAQLASYEVLTASGYALAGQLHVPPSLAQGLVIVGSSLGAAVASSLASQPGDTVLSELYKDGDSIQKPITEVLRSLGAAEFWRGTGARLLHVVAIVSTQLMLYDIVKQVVGLSVTGSG